MIKSFSITYLIMLCNKTLWFYTFHLWILVLPTVLVFTLNARGLLIYCTLYPFHIWYYIYGHNTFSERQIKLQFIIERFGMCIYN